MKKNTTNRDSNFLSPNRMIRRAAFIGLLALGLAVGLAMAYHLPTTNEVTTMELPRINAEYQATTPPIDAAQPEKFETATFGMG